MMKFALVSATALGLSAQGFGFSVFNGFDLVSSAGDPRPNANAAFASYISVAAASSSVSLINFENLPIGTRNGVVASNASVATTLVGASTGVATESTLSQGFNTSFGGSKFYRISPESFFFTARVQFNFANPVNTFGAFFTGVGTFTSNTSIRWTNSQGDQVAFANGNSSETVRFLGIVDPGEEFSSVSIELSLPAFGGFNNDVIGIDDVVYSNCNPVPEPATLAALGIGALALLRRKRSS